MIVYLYDPFTEQRVKLQYKIESQNDAVKIVKQIREEGLWSGPRYWAPSSFCYAEIS